MSNDNKILELHESNKIKLDDDISLDSNDTKTNRKSNIELAGHVKIMDDEGNVVLEKDNKIVLRGRVFALEKIFDLENNLNLGYKSNNLAKKKVCLFKCGKGGTIEGQPFNVLPVIPSDSRTLGEEIPFKLDVDNTPIKGYYERKELKDQPDKYGYFAKEIDSIEWGKHIPEGYYDDDEDEVFVKLVLKIDRDDFATVEDVDENGQSVYKRSTFLNEIGLFIANHIKTELTDKMEDVEMFSRICFESEPFFNNTKTLTIHYYIYA